MPDQNPSVRYEASDASFCWVVRIVVVALVAAAIIHVGVFAFFRGYRRHLDEIDRSQSPLAPVPSQALPREPRLEQFDRLTDSGPASDSLPEANLGRYSRAQENGFVRVPIERAMEHLDGKLPARDEPSAEQTRRAGGLVDAGEPNSGRLFRKEKR
jgi:hypothetical protein